MDTPVDLRSFSPEELRTEVTRRGEKAYRAEQLFRWLHGPAGAGIARDPITGDKRDPLGTSNVPLGLREDLLKAAPLRPLGVDTLQESRDGTRKFRFRTFDDRFIESVLIPDDDEERDRLTLCISSQVGCALDCSFCATATLGFGRHLSAGEIIEQVYWASAVAGRRPTNIVFMGMGEPMHNLAQVRRAFLLLSHPWGSGFSPRRITVSTAGLVKGIDELGSQDPVPNLAISLNATTDDVRDVVMPINKKWPLAELLGAAKRFPLGHNRKVTFEYVLLAGVNDTDADAARLPKLLAGIPSMVNLIPWNPFQGPIYQRPSVQRVAAFQSIVRQAGLPVYVRTPRGDDIDAACGQLAARPAQAAGAEVPALFRIRTHEQP